ncbi:small ribosomal subunit biogenesis GTPase RsgA [Ancylothrix sp. C2]|uniref:small ribosomal subunit biogenesis GTPase RsgA n=1 Tax=Ancylothrix sp. D3o TaxID=2953691 RepID=UPI0021BB2B79|nr:small ribosomal subunit biogenesis GTPase RsgA [Ancylothrix sp. D3o]MCT7950301.1 small ribosomal subunit biogenesis GTPase RsgA [Ancylothrix sp. D3o]
MSLAPTGTVVAQQANYYRVQLDAAQSLPLTILLCTRRARLKKIGQQVMVGDRVVVEEPDWEGGRGAIAEVLPRQSELERPAVANANQILLVFSLAEPELDAHQLSRFLVKAESTGIEPCVCLNKSDLISSQELVEVRENLLDWGYEPIFVSVKQQTGLDQLSEQLAGQITIVCGPSGVGKSSIINYLIPGVKQRVGEVSGKLNRGRHTTRHVELFELPLGGLLADTPGFNQPDLTCTQSELAGFFPEARQRLSEASCQFSDCLHRDEPNCAVRGDWERYEDYLEFLEEVTDWQQALQHQGDAESTLKIKSKLKGSQEYEPKLNTKKYRRTSRRSQIQKLQDISQTDEWEENEEDLD